MQLSGLFEILRQVEIALATAIAGHIGIQPDKRVVDTVQAITLSLGFPDQSCGVVPDALPVGGIDGKTSSPVVQLDEWGR